jgi:hypothetical protein
MLALIWISRKQLEGKIARFRRSSKNKKPALLAAVQHNTRAGAPKMGSKHLVSVCRHNSIDRLMEPTISFVLAILFLNV